MLARQKAVVLILDGAAGWPHADLGGRTTLEAAHTPNLDALAASGVTGLVRTVPEGLEPSSAIACMSVLGFDPTRYYAGRGPIEALAMGIELASGEAAMRCNFVTVADGVMRSYNAGRIEPEDAAPLLEAVRDRLETPRFRFYPGVGFRSIVTVRDGEDAVATECTPAHDIADKSVAEFLPEGPAAAALVDLMEKSKVVLESHPVNQARVRRGQLPATQIWLFWPGMKVKGMPMFVELYGVRAGITTAVDLLRGIGGQVEMELLSIPGVTDGSDNDYEGQMKGALSALDHLDVVFVHVEAPDEAGHAGNVEEKVRAVEDIDRLMVSQVMSRRDLCFLALPDHPTPLALKTHVAEPVPFLLAGPGFTANGAAGYTEAAARETGVLIDPGVGLMRLLVEELQPQRESLQP